jgi:Cys-tRNA(Pro) deacylase
LTLFALESAVDGHRGRTIHPGDSRVARLRSRFSVHLYRYQEHGGTQVAAQALGVSEHCIVKTLVMEDDEERPLIVLMHGDREVSTKQLARQIGARTVAPCKPEVAGKHSGYLIGGTSPLGTRKAMPVYVEKTILDLPVIYINGGRRGLLVRLDPRELTQVLDVVAVEVGIDDRTNEGPFGG